MAAFSQVFQKMQAHGAFLLRDVEGKKSKKAVYTVYRGNGGFPISTRGQALWYSRYIGDSN
jgi:hypothetical protein